MIARGNMLSDVLQCVIREEATPDGIKSAMLTSLSRTTEVVKFAKALLHGRAPYDVTDATLWYFLTAAWTWDRRKTLSASKRLQYVNETNFLLRITRKYLGFLLRDVTELGDSEVEVNSRFNVENAGLGVFATTTLKKGQCFYSVLHEGINMTVSVRCI